MVSKPQRTARWLALSLLANLVFMVGAAVFLATKGGWSYLNGKLSAGEGRRFSSTRLYQGRIDTWAAMPAKRGAWVFVGDSLTDYAPTDELFGIPSLNRGVAGDRVADVAARASEIGRHAPAGIVLWVGINDLQSGTPCTRVAQDIVQLSRSLHSRSPGARIVVLGLIPVAPAMGKQPLQLNDAIRCTNRALESALLQPEFQFLNPGSRFSDENGTLVAAYTSDGIHLNGAGYRAWAAWLVEALHWKQVDTPL